MLKAASHSSKKQAHNEVFVMRVVGANKRPGYKQLPGLASNGSDTPGVGNLLRSTVNEQQQFDTLVLVETSVYSLDLNELIWSSASRTANPKDLGSLVNEVVEATAKEMVKQGLLARQ